MSGQRTGGKRVHHQKGDSQTKTGGAGGPSTGGADGDRRPPEQDDKKPEQPAG